MSAGPKVCLLHTVPSLTGLFTQLVAEDIGPLDVFHIVDESLLADRIADAPFSRTFRRVAAYAHFAEESGARAVLVTCSSIGDAVAHARSAVDIPVFRVDEPMAEEAVASGARVGVLATLRSTLEPTSRLVREKARERGADSTVVTALCDGAFDALREGDRGEHDRIVGAKAIELAADVDVIVLAQASMSQVLEKLPPDALSIPILSSPRSGVRQLAALVS